MWHNTNNSPKSDSTPQAIHTTRDIPMLPEFFRMPFGEMKIPAPMMVPMMIEIPRSRVTFFPSSTFLSLSCSFPLGSVWVPFGEDLYPFASTATQFGEDKDCFDIIRQHTYTHYFSRDFDTSCVPMVWWSPNLCDWCRESYQTGSPTKFPGEKDLVTHILSFMLQSH